MKTLAGPLEEALGRPQWQEEYSTSSRKGALRGMHFQTPPAALAKLVFCLSGAVLDVVVDIRRGSPTYGKHLAVELSPEAEIGLYVPEGFAHGYLSLQEGSVVYYRTTHGYAPANDLGISWDSFGFQWPVEGPIMSERDRNQPRLEGFNSPFEFEAEQGA